jgi:AcrR family transcriptional regulator
MAAARTQVTQAIASDASAGVTARDAPPKRKLGRPGIHSRGEIIDAACDLFVLQGYYRTTMQHIADAVGVTKGGVYHYIESKEDVLYTIHNDFIGEGIRRMELAVSSDDTPLDQLRRVIEAQVSLSSTNPSRRAGDAPPQRWKARGIRSAPQRIRITRHSRHPRLRRRGGHQI